MHGWLVGLLCFGDDSQTPLFSHSLCGRMCVPGQTPKLPTCGEKRARLMKALDRQKHELRKVDEKVQALAAVKSSKLKKSASARFQGLARVFRSKYD